MSHLVLLNHETQAIKKPPATFQTVSRRGILRSSLSCLFLFRAHDEHRAVGVTNNWV
jgi:hypothetical protein